MLTISGFGVKLRVWNGHLEIEDGVGLERRHIRLSRVDFGEKRIRRVVCLSEDGYCTLSALKWLAEVGSSFIHLDRLGKVLFVTGPTAPSDPRRRLFQAIATTNGVGLTISKVLIEAKLKGQENLVREKMKDSAAADTIAGFRARVASAENLDVLRGYEARAAVAYWNAWRDVPIMWPKADSRKIPQQWRTFGTRASVLSGGPRLSTSPGNSMLNYVFALCESSACLALNALGLDPGIGYLHLPRANRDSLALDIMEPIRAEVERWLLSWLMTEPFSRKDFFETATGNCRLMTSVCEKLSSTAPTWGKLLAPWAEYVAGELWRSVQGRMSKSDRPLASRLTQAHSREAKGSDVPAVNLPATDHLCEVCGAKIRRRNSKRCAKCTKQVTRANFTAGRVAAKNPEHRAKMANTMRAHKRAIATWNPADLPAWLDRDAYRTRVLPALASVTPTQIVSALKVSWPYAKAIQSGTIPHMRHWPALAKLAGISR